MNINEIKRFVSKHFLLITFIVYLFISFSGVLFHEPWRDEAQAWLIARDLSPADIIKQMPYEGSPGLWHFIQLPFAKSGFPYMTQALIHWIIAIISVFIFLYKSPFNKITKFLFVFSFLVIYEYSVVARNYNLTILALFIIAGFFKQRFIKPFIYAIGVFVLFNSNIHSFASAFAFFFKSW